MADYLPLALIVSWTASRLRVDCPHCEDFHEHEQTAVAPTIDRCVGEDEYRIDNPCQPSRVASEYGWEIDRNERAIYTVTRAGRVLRPATSFQGHRVVDKRFPASGSDHANPIRHDWKSIIGTHEIAELTAGQPNTASVSERVLEDSLHGLKLDSGSQSISEASQSTSPASSHGKMANSVMLRDQYASACASGSMEILACLFWTYPDVDIASFNDDESSNGILLAAGAEHGIETIDWLRGKGVLLEKTNMFGRTPLMEASLWGRIDTVKYLLQNGARIAAVDGQESASSSTATHLAMDTGRDQAERLRRCVSGYREPILAGKHRRLIINILEKQTELDDNHKNSRASPTTAPDLFMTLASGHRVLYKPSDIHPPPYPMNFRDQKTFGYLDRGPQYPSVYAMSGRSQPDHPVVINNTLWTAKVLVICKYLGHQMSERYASHVEPQLVAYYLDKHFGIQKDYPWDGRPNDPFHLRLPLPPCNIAISNNTKPCSECKNFLKLVHDQLDMEIKVVGTLSASQVVVYETPAEEDIIYFGRIHTQGRGT